MPAGYGIVAAWRANLCPDNATYFLNTRLVTQAKISVVLALMKSEREPIRFFNYVAKETQHFIVRPKEE